MSEKLPLDAALKVTNVHLLLCPPRSLGVFYGNCLGLHDAWNNGAELKGDAGHCSSAFKCGTCPAQKLRRQEIEAGETLYYTEGTGVISAPPGFRMPKQATPGYARGWMAPERAGIVRESSYTPKPHNAPRARPAPAIAPSKTTDDAPSFVAHGVESLVTVMAKDAVAASKSTKGDSLMELARRMMEAKNG